MVQGRHITRLQFARLYVVLLCLVQLSLFVVAKRSVVVRLEMTSVEGNRFAVVFNGFFVVFCLSVSKASVVVEVGLIVLKSNRL